MYKMMLTSLGVIDEDGSSFTDVGGFTPIDPDTVAKAIPMMMRRRLKGAGRSAVALGCQALSAVDGAVDLVVFASRTGETLRCLQMLREVVAGKALSPADFSGSVHNATVGILSIVCKFKGETTAVAASSHTFRAGMEEAYAALYGGRASRVLVVCFEDNLLAQEVMDFKGHEEFGKAWAVTFMLERADADALVGQEPNAVTLDSEPSLSQVQSLPKVIAFSGASAIDSRTALMAARSILAGDLSFGDA